MGLEVATYVSDLVSSNPVGATDAKSQGDDHLRLLKSVLQSTFPNASKPYYLPQILSKSADYSMLVGDDNSLVLVDSTGANRTISLPNTGTINAGFSTTIFKQVAANSVIVDTPGAETINGAASITLSSQYEHVTVEWDGTTWNIVSFRSPLTTRGDLYTRGAAADARLAIGAAATALVTDGTDPSWAKINGTHIRMGSDAQGDVYYFDGTNVVRLPAGTAKQFLQTQGAGANPIWAAAASSVAIYQNQQPSGTNGPTALGGGAWSTFPLNTEVVDVDGIGSLAANQITLGAGTYEFFASAQPGVKGGNKIDVRLRIRNATDGTTVAQGTQLHQGNNGEYHTETVFGVTTIAGSKAFELQVWTSLATDANLAITTGDVEVYATVYIRKIA